MKGQTADNLSKKVESSSLNKPKLTPTDLFLMKDYAKLKCDTADGVYWKNVYDKLDAEIIERIKEYIA